MFYKENYDEKILDFRYRISRCIDRLNFAALYVINRNALESALVIAIRESGLELNEYEKEHLEELIHLTVDYIVSKIFLSDREVSNYVNTLRMMMISLARKNEVEKTIKEDYW